MAPAQLADGPSDSVLSERRREFKPVRSHGCASQDLPPLQFFVDNLGEMMPLQ